MIDAPGIPWLSRFRSGMEKIEQRFMPSFFVGGVSVGSRKLMYEPFDTNDGQLKI